MTQHSHTQTPITRKWWKEAVAYQIYPRSFQDSNGDGIGDIPGIISRLDYLSILGIDVIWLSPVFESPNDDNGYDISDYQAILSDFGTMDDFDELLEQAHQRGIRILLDLVINHTSDEHPWFIESKSSKNSPKRDWYIWQKSDNGLPNNWHSIFSEPAWTHDAHTEEYYLHVFSTKQPDLNWKNPKMRQALYQMIRWWLDKGVDGFRIDAITHIKKAEGFPDEKNQSEQLSKPSTKMYTNLPGIHDYINELCREAFDGYDIMTVGEASGVEVHDAPNWVGEDVDRFNMIFQFEQLRLWGHADEMSLHLLELKKVLNRWQTKLHGRGWNALFVENHDVPRTVSIWGNDTHFWHESSTAIATMYFLMQGTPFIYQGQELGMTNFQFTSLDQFDDVAVRNYAQVKFAEGWSEIDIINDIQNTARDNSRTPMQWSKANGAGFTTGKSWLPINKNHLWLNAESQRDDPHSVFNYYRKLIQLRKTYKGLVYGRFQMLMADHEQMFVYQRHWDDEVFIITVNMSDDIAEIELPVACDQAEILIHNITDADGASGVFKPWEARLYRLA
ncbi:MAG: alpha-glucosidase [Reinekea sp.]